MLNSLPTVPPVRTHASFEDITWPCDMTGYLVGAQTPTVPTSLLFDLSTDTTVALVDAPTVSGNTVNQRVRAGVLVGGHTYRLTFIVTPSGTINVLGADLELDCPH